MSVIEQTTITNFTYKGVNLTITEVTLSSGDSRRDSRYQLVWDDGVANEWVETYLSLPVALARVAALIACEDGDGISFPHDKDEFTIVANAFLHGVAR